MDELRARQGKQRIHRLKLGVRGNLRTDSPTVLTDFQSLCQIQPSSHDPSWIHSHHAGPSQLQFP